MILARSDALRLRAWGRRDPVGWARRVLGLEPWEAERRILRAVRDNRRVAVRSGHGVGKTTTAAVAALWFLSCWEDSVVATTAPTSTQVTRILWQEIRKLHSKALLPLGGTLPPRAPEIHVRDGWHAYGFSTDKPERAQGLHGRHVLLVLDEAAGIHPAIWEALEGALSGGHARILMNGNPTQASGPFADEFRPGSGTCMIHVSAFDSPNVTAGREVIPGLVTAEWIEERRRRWGENSPMYRSRVLGEFPEADENVLIPQSWWALAAERDLSTEPGEASALPELGVDVGGDGDGSDFSVIGRRRGSVYRTLFRRAGYDTVELQGEIRRLQRENRVGTWIPPAKVDAIGIGKGVSDGLRHAGVPSVAVVVSRAAVRSDQFVNLRAELLWHLRERFDPDHPTWGGRIDVSDEDMELEAQASSIRWGTARDGRIFIEAKKDYKKRTGRGSPDDLDAMALTFANAPDQGGLWYEEKGGRESDFLGR